MWRYCKSKYGTGITWLDAARGYDAVASTPPPIVMDQSEGDRVSAPATTAESEPVS